MAARPCDRPPGPLQRQEQGTAPSSPGTMTPDCPAPEGDARHSQATLRAFPLPKGAGQNDVWMKGTLRQRKPHLSSPKSAARLSWATLSCFIVAQGCSTALLGNTFALFRRPRVQHGTLGRHFRTSSSPEGAGQNDVWMKETLRRRKPHLSSPKSAARHAWATLSHFFVARGCSTARLGNTFALFRRPRVQHDTLERHFRTSSSPEGATRHAWATPPRVSAARRYWAKDVRLNLTKKEEVSQKRGRLQ